MITDVLTVTSLDIVSLIVSAMADRDKRSGRRDDFRQDRRDFGDRSNGRWERDDKNVRRNAFEKSDKAK